MVTDAGGRLTGIRGWGIIIKGSSSPKSRKYTDHHCCTPDGIIIDMSLRVKPLKNTLIVMVKKKVSLYTVIFTHDWEVKLTICRHNSSHHCLCLFQCVCV